jgi:N-acetyl-beta-hexosaminidase
LNKGQGNLWLNASQGEYTVWRNIYENLTVFPQGVDRSRILGAEACLWGEVSNEDTLENNLWMRATAFASRVWSEKILNTYEIVASLVQIQYALYAMDVDASPVTSEFCEHKPKVCFPPPAEQVSEVAII